MVSTSFLLRVLRFFAAYVRLDAARLCTGGSERGRRSNESTLNLIFNLQSSIFNLRTSILDHSIHYTFHDRQQFDWFKGLANMNLEPGDQSADAVFGASIGRERYSRDVPTLIRVHRPHLSH